MLRCVIFNDDSRQLNDMWETLKATTELELAEIDLSSSEARDVLDYARIPRSDHTIFFLTLNSNDKKLEQTLKLCQSISKLDAHSYIIFVSAWSQYALACCKAHAFDFLLSPFTLSQLLSSVEAVQQDIYGREQVLPLIVKTDGHILRINMKNILYFCRDRDYLNAFILNDSLRWRETFTSLLSRLDQKIFVRSHNSFVVNVQYIMEVNTGTKHLHMANGDDIPYSRRNEQNLFHTLNQHVPLFSPTASALNNGRWFCS